MSKRRRGRITVQNQPTGAARGMMRGMGVVHAVFGGVFAFIAITEIIPSAGIIGLPFLAVGAFFCINGIRMAVSKNGMAQRVGYEVETDIEHEVISGLMEEPYVEPSPGVSPSPAVLETNAKQRLEQLESLRTSGLITQQEYEEKREEIIDQL